MDNIKQQGLMDCGPACLAGIAQFYGKTISLSHIRQLAQTGDQGTSLAGLQDAASQLGFQAEAVQGDYEGLQQAPLPALIHLERTGLVAHYIIVDQVTRHGISLRDPADGKAYRWSRQKLEHYWSGAALLLLPDPPLRTVGVSAEYRITRPIRSLLRPLRSKLIQLVALPLLTTLLSGSSVLVIPDHGQADRPETRYTH